MSSLPPELHELARRQQGLFQLRQFEELYEDRRGLSDALMAHEVALEARGVFGVYDELGKQASNLAQLWSLLYDHSFDELATQRLLVGSHLTAANVLGYYGTPSGVTFVGDVEVRDSLDLRVFRKLVPPGVIVVDGLPVTDALTTIVDLAIDEDLDDLGRVIGFALADEAVTRAEVAKALAFLAERHGYDEGEEAFADYLVSLS